MKWVTWENVGVDRMACAWLIRKHIDAKAKFLFLPKGSKEIPQGAEPFDIPGVRLSHHRGHCSFHTLLSEYKLDDPILKRIARIVDEADTVQEVCVEPAAPGLDLICEGIRKISPNDEMALTHGALVYEALYAQLAAEVQATMEV
ncbi:MAG: chromate resistance protein [Planctomycetes bacterium]|nr:chromate resistance protein [Planctomycetota bacterium]